MSGLILTLEEYEAAIPRHYHEAMAIMRSRQQAMSRRIFTPWAIRRFIEHIPKYGPLDLTARNWIQNQAEELVDAPAYGIFELVAKERGL